MCYRPLLIHSEALSESTSSLSPESRQVASLLCSKIYFYLGDMSEAVNLALNAGDAFARSSGEFKETMICEWDILKVL